jgi:hypothetical protein
MILKRNSRNYCRVSCAGMTKDPNFKAEKEELNKFMGKNKKLNKKIGN